MGRSRAQQHELHGSSNLTAQQEKEEVGEETMVGCWLRQRHKQQQPQRMEALASAASAVEKEQAERNL